MLRINNGCHFGWRTELTDTIIKGNKQSTIQARFRLFGRVASEDKIFKITYLRSAAYKNVKIVQRHETPPRIMRGQYNLVWPILSVNTMQNMRAITSTNDEIAELINIFPPNFPIFNVIP
jgi:hypothetical protein